MRLIETEHCFVSFLSVETKTSGGLGEAILVASRI